MTVTPTAGPSSVYTSLTDPNANTPLPGSGLPPIQGPSHADLHGKVNAAIKDLDVRQQKVENDLAALQLPNGPIDQARLTTHMWNLYGTMASSYVNRLMLPLLWNLTAHPLDFKAAKATLMKVSDTDTQLQIVTGTTLTSSVYDSGTMPSVMVQPLTIPAGQTTSPTVPTNDFTSQHAVGAWIAMVIVQLSPNGIAADLSLQLDRSV